MGCFIAGVGGVMCVIGPLAIIGPVVFFAGILGMIILPFTIMQGKCPYCGLLVTAQSTSDGMTCRACKRRIVIRQRRLYKIAT